MLTWFTTLRVVRWHHLLMLAVMITFIPAMAMLTRGAESDVVSAKLLVDRTPLVAGQDATLAVQVDVAQGYHIQGAKPYDKFLVATRVEYDKAQQFTADGISAQAPRYPVARDIPAPAAITDAGKLAVYEGTIWILLPIHVDAAAATGSRTLQILLHTQACDHESCQMPTTTKLKVDLQIAAAGTAATLQEKETFDAANKQPLMPVETAATKPAANVTSSTTSQPATQPPGSVATAPAATAIAGVSTDTELELVRSRPYHAANQQANEHSVAYLFLLAILGGAILNIMPCVLPVIPLKILSLVQQAHGQRSVAIAHALVFSAGVITLFVVLAAALGSYHFFSGQQVIYGEQYSHPIFVLTTALIVLALALSMLGVWTINTPQKVYEIAQRSGPGSPTSTTLDYASTNHRNALVGSFMTGVLATLLATPCSAPLLGPVLFWALVHPLPVTMLAFALVGVGMSVPYVILAAYPAGLDRLPKTGRWSELLKQGLGLVMVGVALYLITRIPDPGIWPWALAAALLVGFVCWAWGQIPSPLMEPGRVWTIRGVVLALGLVAAVGLYKFAASAPPTLAVAPSSSGVPLAAGSDWQPFSVAALDQALAQHRPVVVDWTASWCINCRVVEASVLDSQPVQADFVRRNAVLLRADLSGENPVAKELLLKLGGGSIPFLAIFSPQRKYKPAILQDIYSRKTVMAELASAANDTP